MNIETSQRAATRARTMGEFIAQAEWQASEDGLRPEAIGRFATWRLCAITRNLDGQRTAGSVALYNPEAIVILGARVYEVWSVELARVFYAPIAVLRLG